MEINQSKCDVDKRKLSFDAVIEGVSVRYEYNDWGTDTISQLTLNGVITKVTPLIAYKHCVQVMLDMQDSRYGDRMLFIDRRYEHNNSYDVYYSGKSYLVGSEDDQSLSE